MAKIVFLHPDLGIGGAERLVVDAAIALKSCGHTTRFLTSHHDRQHCFSETRDGTIPVTVVGDWIPRKVLGYCYALCAYIRMIYAAIYLVFFSDIEYDLVICDQISVCLPVLKLFTNKKVVFYCHYPDQLLTSRKSLLKKLYRAPLDWFEEYTTGMADSILVNSNYTGRVFRETFLSLRKSNFQVVHPSLNFTSFDKPLASSVSDIVVLKNVNTIFLSINRYERKKNLKLAIAALGLLKSKTSPFVWKGIHLIMAGGYDERVVENVEHFEELNSIVADSGLKDSVTFLRSFSDQQKMALLHSCTALLYTPDNEHFGIVPIEAMYMARPVIAVNSGGPLETVVNDETGLLVDPLVEEFASAMHKLVQDKSLAREMGIQGREHVQRNFSFANFTRQLDEITKNLMEVAEHTD